jgi:two-component system, cell cycle sensor histidine kinase and response regulator CckA
MTTPPARERCLSDGESIHYTMTGNVLLVEDNAALRLLFGMLLRAEGLTVMEAADGQEAIEIIDGSPETIHLLVTDLGLPKVGGIDLIARAREVRPAIRILATSGLGQKNIQKMVKEAGADIFVPKPFSVPEVIEVIKKMNI